MKKELLERLVRSSVVDGPVLSMPCCLSWPLPSLPSHVLLSQPSTDPIRQGYLIKQGEVVKNWKKRWFVVRADYVVEYYETEEKFKAGVSRGLCLRVVLVNGEDRDWGTSWSLLGWALASSHFGPMTRTRTWNRVYDKGNPVPK